MPQIGCKTCGKRRARKPQEIIIPEEIKPTPSQAYLIRSEPKENYIQFDWKSMSKRI